MEYKRVAGMGVVCSLPCTSFPLGSFVLCLCVSGSNIPLYYSVLKILHGRCNDGDADDHDHDHDGGGGDGEEGGLGRSLSYDKEVAS